ncbi:GNAT family N-acetyltransferase [Bulleidia sp. zg-1006]|uniref:GNAT family N-acetyltransferase n=1 Tax=Bulleidia sp. zg-1006 TaxID=2806552 RepID=UPI00193A93FE|nr:GNAT family N-acetyltransferase [Bulleidia sp. zg-1006]QRG87131.1 N-acetyltransferase [Bulleidia sp. zg-1006]
MKLEMRKNRAILLDDKKVVGYCSYVEEGDVWKIDHTVVEEARKQGKRIVPVCSYAIHQFEKHESLQDVLKG